MHGDEGAQDTEQQQEQDAEEVRWPNVIAQARRDKRSDEIKCRYESTKRSRKFNQNWKKSFPWVTLTNKMFCSTCLNSGMLCDKESKFVKGGCGNFHVKALQTHLASEHHKRCAEHQKALTATPRTNPAERALEPMNQQDFDKIRKLFRLLHSIAKRVEPSLTTYGASIFTKQRMAYHSAKPIAMIAHVEFLSVHRRNRTLSFG
jgi:hypothetical protein